MSKLLNERRSQCGEFEVIDFTDAAEIDAMRRSLDVAAAQSARWTWRYDSEVEELRALYEKSKVNQWNAELDLDWSTPLSNDDWVLTPRTSLLAQLCAATGRSEADQKAAAFDELAYALSQLLHGEQAALQLCGQLTNACELMDEKWYAAAQVADEARHVEALSKFLERKMGTIHPIGPTLKFLLETLLTAEGPRKKTLGMQCLFEGVAVGIFDFMRQDSRNALFSDMIRRIEHDEARHAAFGVLKMRRVVREIDEEERADLEDWAFSILEALNANQQLDMLRALGPKYDLDPEQVTQLVTSLPNFAELNSLLYMHTVVPNLKNLGLITERTEPRYRELGIAYDRQRQKLPETSVFAG